MRRASATSAALRWMAVVAWVAGACGGSAAESDTVESDATDESVEEALDTPGEESPADASDVGAESAADEVGPDDSLGDETSGDDDADEAGDAPAPDGVDGEESDTGDADFETTDVADDVEGEGDGAEEVVAICGNGVVEPGEDCEGSAVVPCTTSCGTIGDIDCLDCVFAFGCRPPVEECNRIDDDCDGGTDDLPELECGTGACFRNVPACVGGLPGACVPGVPGVERCIDGVDDDCDGSTDEDCECSDGDVQPCYDGPVGTRGVGACRDGSQLCADGRWGPCEGSLGPQTETCNLVDDDCDGRTDDGLGQFSCGVGACRRTADNCLAGGQAVCTPGTPSPEACDGMDNDCDGETDEGIPGVVVGLGACRRTCPLCVGGVPTRYACLAPYPAVEICNGIDDDCDGAVDDGAGCPCVFVRSPTPDPSVCCNGPSCPGTTAEPLCSIAEALVRAAAPGGSRQVCAATGTYAEAIRMEEGVSLQGGYDPATWSRTSRSTLRNPDDRGVYFPPGTTSATALAGFQIYGRAGVPGPVAGVTIEDSSGTVSDGRIIIGNSSECYGVWMTSSDGTHAPTLGGLTIEREFAPGAPARIAGIRCQGARPIFSGVHPCISTDSPTTETYGVWATDCHGLRASSLEICGGANAGISAAALFEGDVGDTALLNPYVSFSNASRTADSNAGIRLRGCRGAEATWISYGHPEIRSTKTAILVEPGCSAVVQGATDIRGEQGLEAPATTRGIACASGASCTIVDNVRISAIGYSGESVAIDCAPDACGTIQRNGTLSGDGVYAYGDPSATALLVRGGAPWIDRNALNAIAGAPALGIDLLESGARVTNNRISAEGSPGYGIRQTNGVSGVGPEVHSNTIDGGRHAWCVGAAVAITADGMSPPTGIYRNNILHAGLCGTSHAFLELVSGADPAVVQNNDFWNATVATYLDEGSTPVDAAAAINALADIVAAENIVADPAPFPGGPWFLDSPYMDPSSPCWDAGTELGAPAWDFDGNIRPRYFSLGFDIGAFE